MLKSATTLVLGALLVVAASARPNTQWLAQSVAITPFPRTIFEGAEAPIIRQIEYTGTIQLAGNPGVSWAQLAAQYGLTLLPSYAEDPEHVYVRTFHPSMAKSMKEALAKIPGVTSAVAIQVSHRQSTFVANDPYFGPINPIQTLPGQWHLWNKARPMLDVNVRNAWAPKAPGITEVTGQGVVTSIMEEGVEVSHPDLVGNYNSAYSWDYVDNNADPTGPHPHGTSCAGLLAGVGGNGLGVAGSAPKATLSPLRFSLSDDPSIVAAAQRSANVFRVKSMSYGWGSGWLGGTIEYDGYKAAEDAGIILVQSATNSRSIGEGDVGTRPSNQSPKHLNIAAMNSDGKFSSYSSYGSNVFCTAPSGDSAQGKWGMATTDLIGTAGYNTTSSNYTNKDFTNNFSGTSASCPGAAGVIALGVQAQPAMRSRMAQHLLVKTCRIVDPNDTNSNGLGWRANAAGNKFNLNYGFGLIDAAAFVDMAKQYTGVTADASINSATVTVNASVPTTTSGLSRSISVSPNQPLEAVQLYVKLTSTTMWDLEAFLTSPQGLSVPFFRQSNSGAVFTNTDLVFTTFAFWGQSSAGTWTMTFYDRSAPSSTTIQTLSLQMHHGSLTGSVRTLTGTVNLGSWGGGAYGTNATLSFYQPGTTTLVKSHHVTIKPDNTFSFPSSISAGTYDVYVKPWHWLRKKKANVVVSASGANLGTMTFLNGDSNEDNYVGSDDYLVLNSAFDTEPTSLQWDPAADLNGDSYVGTDDYLLMNTAFDITGD